MALDMWLQTFVIVALDRPGPRIIMLTLIKYALKLIGESELQIKPQLQDAT